MPRRRERGLIPNNAKRVAALDERGVTIERDGKQTAFSPWGEDPTARAAAAEAQSTADTATTKANSATSKANSAANKANANEDAISALDGRVTALEEQGGGDAGAYVKQDVAADEVQTAGVKLQAATYAEGDGWALDYSTFSLVGGENCAVTMKVNEGVPPDAAELSLQSGDDQGAQNCLMFHIEQTPEEQASSGAQAWLFKDGSQTPVRLDLAKVFAKLIELGCGI